MEILGLPLHPLIVHATVVIVPLAALGAIVISLLKWARLRYSELVLVAAIAAPILTYVTQQAGEDLSKTFTQPSAALQRHEALGGTLLWWTVGLLVGVMLVYHRSAAGDQGASEGPAAADHRVGAEHRVRRRHHRAGRPDRARRGDGGVGRRVGEAQRVDRTTAVTMTISSMAARTPDTIRRRVRGFMRSG